MYFAAAVLTILSGLFYTAGRHEIGSISADVCSYGGTFCQNPHYVLVGAIVAGLWGLSSACAEPRASSSFRDDIAMPLICPTCQRREDAIGRG